MNNIQYIDTVILGSGPVGIYTTFYCNSLGISTITIDAMKDIGGQCTFLYPDKYIYDIPGFSQITARNLVQQLQIQTEYFKSEFLLNTTVTNIEKNQQGYILYGLDNVIICQCKFIIIATGNGVLNNMKLPIDGIEDFFTKTIIMAVENIEDLRNKNVIVAGGGDSALDWTIESANVAKSVKILHRRNKFSAKDVNIKKMQELIIKGKVELLTPYSLVGVKGDNITGQIHKVTIFNINNEEEYDISADYLIPCYGIQASKMLKFQNDILEYENNILSFETKYQNIFSIGDSAIYSGKNKSILSGFFEGSSVAREIKRRLN